MKRVVALLSVAALLVVLHPQAVNAQADSGETAGADTAERGEGSGYVTLTDWPESLSRLLEEMGSRAPYLLPKLDSLALDYRYAADDSTSQWSFVLGWRPGDEVLYEGEVLPRSRAPSRLQMVNVELRAEVRVEGRYVGDMIVAVDSMALSPYPSIYSFEVRVGHERVLLDASAETAREALLDGITLHDIVVERMGFVSDEVSTSDRSRSPDTRERRPTPRREPSIYEPSTNIFIGWRVAPRPYYVGDRGQKRSDEPRGESMGRGASGEENRGERTADREDGNSERQEEGRGTRTADSSGEGSADDEDEDDDDDDETSLRAPALMAVAAVGLVAYAGGTVGLYGHGETPIGLAAGYTKPRGGVQLHAAVNGAVLEGDSGQKLTLKALGFYDAFSSPIQPALGVGVQIDPSKDSGAAPSISVGVAGNFGRIVVFGGFDVIQQTPEVGLSYNFRYGRAR